MREFLEGPGCLMEFLRRELDDPQAAPCGRCARCLGHSLFSHDVDDALVREAFNFLRDQWFTLEPRKQWPDGSRIPANERAEPGRILSLSGDGGWSRTIEQQKHGGAYDDELVEGLIELTGGKAPDPLPTWVTCVPSLRHPDLVPSLAARFAARPAAAVPVRSFRRRARRAASGDGQLVATVRATCRACSRSKARFPRAPRTSSTTSSTPDGRSPSSRRGSAERAPGRCSRSRSTPGPTDASERGPVQIGAVAHPGVVQERERAVARRRNVR